MSISRIIITIALLLSLLACTSQLQCDTANFQAGVTFGMQALQKVQAAHRAGRLPDFGQTNNDLISLAQAIWRVETWTQETVNEIS
jgi:hypothetical protein